MTTYATVRLQDVGISNGIVYKTGKRTKRKKNIPAECPSNASYRPIETKGPGTTDATSPMT